MGFEDDRAVVRGRVGRRRRLAAGGKHLVAVSLVVTAACSVLAGTAARAVAADGRPNIVLITADDMNESDLRWMPETRRLLGRSGVQVDDFLSNHPLCCPARAQILTGQHAQNNGVYTNDGPRGGYDALADTGNNVGRWLKSAGYKTAFVGKHMNHWPENGERQPGWTVFDPILKGVYWPFGLTMYNNGHPRRYPRTHTSDLMGGLTVKYIKRFSASGSPFFIWTSQVAPHNMVYNGAYRVPVPAERHRDLYPNALPPSFADPAFNEDDVRDKPDYVQTGKVDRRAMIRLHRARIRSLRSVDDQVAAAVDALEATGELDNTYVFFTSDNGFLLGEHRQTGKSKPYEPILQVPLLVRGPGLPRGTVRPATYGLVDLAATFVDIAEATAGRLLDGRSMLGTLHRGLPGYGQYLIQSGSRPHAAEPWWWRGVRSRRYVYVRYDSGFEELYDMASDPAQLDNVASDPAFAAVREDYAARLTALEACAGEACWTGGDAAVVTFADSVRRVREDAGAVQVRVVRGGNVRIPATVDYTAGAGSATGPDFALAPGTLRFGVGETSKSIAVRVRNDARAELAETLRISLRPADRHTVTPPLGALRLVIGTSDQQPDAAVSAEAAPDASKFSAYVGDDVYNVTGAKQTQQLSARRRQTRTFRVRVGNDGNARTTMSLTGSAPRSGAKVRYYSAAADRTRAMLSPRGWRVTLPPDGRRTVEVRITVLGTAAIGSAKRAAVRALWSGDGRRADVAGAVVRVVR